MEGQKVLSVCWIQELENLEIMLEINILVLTAVFPWKFLLQVRGTQTKLPKANEKRHMETLE